jgi:hypothetical protein
MLSHLMKQTKQEYLQSIWDNLKEPIHFDFVIEFRPGAGWYAIADEPRHFNDDGEYLGRDWREAEKALRKLI